MTRAEQIRRYVIDEWRMVSERDKETLVKCLANAADPSLRARLVGTLDSIINKRGDMK